MLKPKRVWFWETCTCGLHGRYVTQDRYNFTPECGCMAEAIDMLELIRDHDKLPDSVVDSLYVDLWHSGLPRERLGIDLELRLPLKAWNEVHGEIMDTEAPFYDPLDFHVLDARLIPGGMRAVH